MCVVPSARDPPAPQNGLLAHRGQELSYGRERGGDEPALDAADCCLSGSGAQRELPLAQAETGARRAYEVSGLHTRDDIKKDINPCGERSAGAPQLGHTRCSAASIIRSASRTGCEDVGRGQRAAETS